MIVMVTPSQSFVRLLFITVISAIIGIEREYHHKPAGLRTNVMVGLGATLMTIASIKIIELTPIPDGTDTSRIAAQIVSGIGFIGAGAILRPASGKGNLIGLTTAATLWVVAGLGIAVGMGFYFEAVLTTFLVLFTFLVLSKLVARVRAYTKAHPPVHEHDEDLVETINDKET